MIDRAVRSLEHLKSSASTARVLNLLRVWEDHGDSGIDGAVRNSEWADYPLFRTRALNRALIIKHRLRRNETDLFTGRRQVATKVVVPIDDKELKTGGRYVFVNQIGFERVIMAAFGVAPNHPDIETLRLIDKLPSLDPFLLREQLRRSGLDPAPCYFSISENDLQRMQAFVRSEIERCCQSNANLFPLKSRKAMWDSTLWPISRSSVIDTSLTSFARRFGSTIASP